MNKLYCIFFIYFYTMFSSPAQERKNISFLTVVGSSLSNVNVQAHNAAYINGMKIIGTRTTKQGNTWTKIVKIEPK